MTERPLFQIVAKPGEPDGDQRDRWLELVTQGELPYRAARQVGVTLSAIRRLANQNEVFAEARAQALETGRHVRENLVDEAVETWAVQDDAPPAMRLAWAKRWNHAYRDSSRVEMTGATGGPVEVANTDVAEAIDRFTDLVARAIAARDTRPVDEPAHAAGNGRVGLPVGRLDGKAEPNGAAG